MKFQSRDCSFNCIPNAHENRARVARPFLPRAGDAIHPALREREGSGFETTNTVECMQMYPLGYRMAGNSRGVLIFVIFVVDLAVTKISTHEN